MRAAGEGRNGKFDTTRVVGIGMMLSGVLAFTFAVAGPSGAGSTSGAATPQHVECQQTSTSGTMGEVAQAISRGCHTTTTYNQCTCHNTTTTYGDTTTTESTTTSSTTTSTTMAPSTSLAGETSTLATTTTTVPEDTTTSTTTAGIVGPTTTAEHTVVSAGNVTTSIGVEGSTATLPPAIQTSPTSGVLPFTGGSPAPLAGLGLVLLGTGAGLSRRKRRLAD